MVTLCHLPLVFEKVPVSRFTSYSPQRRPFFSKSPRRAAVGRPCNSDTTSIPAYRVPYLPMAARRWLIAGDGAVTRDPGSRWVECSAAGPSPYTAAPRGDRSDSFLVWFVLAVIYRGCPISYSQRRGRSRRLDVWRERCENMPRG